MALASPPQSSRRCEMVKTPSPFPVVMRLESAKPTFFSATHSEGRRLRNRLTEDSPWQLRRATMPAARREPALVSRGASLSEDCMHVAGRMCVAVVVGCGLGVDAAPLGWEGGVGIRLMRWYKSEGAFACISATESPPGSAARPRFHARGAHATHRSRPRSPTPRASSHAANT